MTLAAAVESVLTQDYFIDLCVDRLMNHLEKVKAEDPRLYDRLMKQLEKDIQKYRVDGFL